VRGYRDSLVLPLADKSVLVLNEDEAEWAARLIGQWLLDRQSEMGGGSC